MTGGGKTFTANSRLLHLQSLRTRELENVHYYIFHFYFDSRHSRIPWWQKMWVFSPLKQSRALSFSWKPDSYSLPPLFLSPKIKHEKQETERFIYGESSFAHSDGASLTSAWLGWLDGEALLLLDSFEDSSPLLPGLSSSFFHFLLQKKAPKAVKMRIRATATQTMTRLEIIQLSTGKGCLPDGNSLAFFRLLFSLGRLHPSAACCLQLGAALYRRIFSCRFSRHCPWCGCSRLLRRRCPTSRLLPSFRTPSRLLRGHSRPCRPPLRRLRPSSRAPPRHLFCTSATTLLHRLLCRLERGKVKVTPGTLYNSLSSIKIASSPPNFPKISVSRRKSSRSMARSLT